VQATRISSGTRTGSPFIHSDSIVSSARNSHLRGNTTSESLSVMITGASRGFGAALVDAYVERAARVIALVRKEEARRTLAKKYGAAVDVVLADVARSSDETQVRSQLALLDRRVDLLINNAGAPGTTPGLEKADDAEIESLFQTHCLGALRITRAALPFLLRSQEPAVVNISSRISSMQRNAEGQFALRKYTYGYRIAKAAQNMLTLCLMEEFGAQGLRILAVHPGQLTTVSVSGAAASTPEEAAQMFIEFMESDRAAGRVPAVLQDTAGRIIPW
jgi:NAD(P)-dependent dehydrogenase (short-subunit alcohol dehydrogenase family)